MNKFRGKSGFTLIELIVVLGIISLLLLFSFPKFRYLGLFQNTTGQIGAIARLIDDLKIRSVEKHLDYTMHLDSGAGRIWVTDTAMDEEAQKAAEDKSTLISENIKILDVEFPVRKETNYKEYQIDFNKKGYSDFALIHVMDKDQNITFKIEPFLPRVQLLEKHVYFKDCF